MTNRARQLASGRSGFTYVEMMIAIGVLIMALGSVFMVSMRSTAAFKTSDSRATANSKVQAALQTVMEELSGTSVGVMFPDPDTDGASSINYRRAIGYDAGAILWSDLRRLAFEYEAGEVDDGVDNNGDGQIDEGILVLTRKVGEPGEQRVVLTHGLREHLEGEAFDGNDTNGNGMDDENGFCVQRVGPLLHVFMTVEEEDADGFRFQRTLNSSTKLRN